MWWKRQKGHREHPDSDHAVAPETSCSESNFTTSVKVKHFAMFKDKAAPQNQPLLNPIPIRNLGDSHHSDRTLHPEL